MGEEMKQEAPMPRVSVIIPAYNSAQFITQAIQSVLAQTYTSYEILVVDDGSTDQTQAVVLQHRDRVVYIRQDNNGPSAARNTGIRAARGEYICFLDADDTWTPNKLEAQVAFMEQHPELGLLFSDEEEGNDEKILHPSILAKTKFRDNIVSQVPLQEAFRKLVRENFIPTSTVMIKKACFAQTELFDNAFRSAEDRDLWLRMAAHTQIGSLPVVLGRKRVHLANISADNELALRSKIRVWQKNRQLFPSLAPPAVWHDRFADAQLKLGYVLLAKGQKKEARQAGVKSLLHAVQSVRGRKLREESFLSYQWSLGGWLILCATTSQAITQPLLQMKKSLWRLRKA